MWFKFYCFWFLGHLPVAIVTRCSPRKPPLRFMRESTLANDHISVDTVQDSSLSMARKRFMKKGIWDWKCQSPLGCINVRCVIKLFRLPVPYTLIKKLMGRGFISVRCVLSLSLYETIYASIWRWLNVSRISLYLVKELLNISVNSFFWWQTSRLYCMRQGVCLCWKFTRCENSQWHMEFD